MKSEYSISPVTKKSCVPLLTRHHYLTSLSNGFKSGYNFGLFKADLMVGVCIFTTHPVAELVQSMYGLDRKEQDGFFELSRLCLSPDVQAAEHNITGWFVSRCIKALRAATPVRSILSYADSTYHKGTIYRAIGFEYFGLTEPKQDFWFLNEDGTYTKHVRGPVRGRAGEWRDRSDKHRYVKVFDKTLTMKWKKSC